MGLRRIVFFAALSALFFLSPSLSWAVSRSVTSPLLKKPPQAAGEPIHLTSDRLEYFKDENFYSAEGSVVVTQGPLRIESDFLTLDQETGRLIATGDVHLTDGENKVDADQLEYNVDTQMGFLFDAKLFIKSENYHIAGEEMERREIDRYDLKDASFTACDCEEDPDWRIRAGRLRLYLDHFLVARDVVFYVDDLPIFYFPYFIYPAKTERQTGLLVPRFGYSSHFGFKYNQAFYWAISQSQDATVSVNHLGLLGDGGGLEYRYVMSRGSSGILQANYFDDRQNRVGRWDVTYNHQQRFSDRVTAKLDLHYINQQNNFLQLSDVTAERAQANIESDFFLTYRGDESFAYLLARYTLSLTAPNNDTTLQRLPEVGYSVTQRRLGDSPLFFNLESSAVNFWRAAGLKAERVDLYPKLSLPIPMGEGATLTPWAGFRETAYSRGVSEDRPVSRRMFPMGVSLEDRFYGDWGSVTHLITPLLEYEYIPVSDISDIPQFDDIDLLHDRNAVTASLGQRFLLRDEKGNLIEKVYFRLTESYNIRDALSNLPDPQPYSDLRGEGTFRPFGPVEIRLDSFYNFHYHNLTSWNTDVDYKAASFLTLSLGQRYTRAGLIAIKGDLINPIYLGDREATPRIKFWTEKVVVRTPWGVALASRAYYDPDQKQFVEIDYGLRYERQCWMATLTYIDLRDRNDLLFMLTLKGLGGTPSRGFVDLF